MDARNSEPREWRELTWPDMVKPAEAYNALEQIAAASSFGPLVLEARADRNGIRWLLGGKPTRLDAIDASLRSALAVRTRVPRRVRRKMQFAVSLRVVGKDLSLDPVRTVASTRALYAALSRLEQGEGVVIQLQIGRRHTPPVMPREPAASWLMVLAKSPIKSVSSVGASQRHRAEQHGFSASFRIGVTGASQSRARQLVGDIAGALRVLETSTSRIRFVEEVPRHVDDASTPWRWPMRLTSGEAVGLLGWPVGEPPLPLLGGIHPRQMPPPATLVATERVVGVASTPGHGDKLGIPIRDAAYHTHILGPTGSAKSTVMLSLIAADMNAGRGVLVLDPKGDLADNVLAQVPKGREQDVVVLDPTNSSPVGFNPLSTQGRLSSVAADALLSTFEAVFSKYWGIRSADIFTAVFNTLVQVPGANLLWIQPLLTDPGFRRKILKQIDDPVGLGGFWDQYETKTPARQAEEIGPVLNKLRQLILRPGLRAMLGQSEPKFELGDLFSQRRIVIVNLNKGLLGAEAAKLLGSLLIGQLWTQLLARQRLPIARRHIVGVYIDEVHDFLSGLPGDLSDALAQARSLGAAFTVANQYLKQFTQEMQASIETNTRSKIYFGLGGTDAQTVAKHTKELDAQDFILLPKYHAYANVMQQGQATGWVSIATLPPIAATNDQAALYAASHERYGVSAADTDQRIRDLIAPPTPAFTEADEGPIGRSRR